MKLFKFRFSAEKRLAIVVRQSPFIVRKPSAGRASAARGVKGHQLAARTGYRSTSGSIVMGRGVFPGLPSAAVHTTL